MKNNQMFIKCEKPVNTTSKQKAEIRNIMELQNIYKAMDWNTKNASVKTLLNFTKEKIQYSRATLKDYVNGQKDFRYLCRYVNGSIIKVAIIRNRIDKGLLLKLREVIKYRRNQDRQLNHYLFNRETGHYLKQHQKKQLTKAKYPVDDNEYIGIEIECIIPRSVKFDTLMPFAKYIDIAHDGSISDYDSEKERDAEIRVCLKREEVTTVIPPLMKALRAIGARVNKTCGLHVHLDQRNHANDVGLRYQKLVRSLHLLYMVVPKSRRDNGYCLKNETVSFHDAINGTRYRAINASAYRHHKTLEVRLFGATLEAGKIINWIETLTGIMDGAMVLRCPKNFDTAAKHWKLSDANVNWLKERQKRFAPLNEFAPVSESEAEENQELLTVNG